MNRTQLCLGLLFFLTVLPARAIDVQSSIRLGDELLSPYHRSIFNRPAFKADAFAPRPVPSAVPFEQRLQAVLDKQIKDRLHGAGITAAVSFRGQPYWIGAAGYAKLGAATLRDNSGREILDEYGLPQRQGAVRMQPDDLHFIASNSKIYLAAAILRLAEEGRLTLSDPVAQWLPDVRVPYADRMTVRQLLSHTAGVFDYTKDMNFWNLFVRNPNRVFTSRQLLAYVYNNKPYFEPGETGKFEYSNTGFYLAALILEQAAGMPFHEALSHYLYTPLGLEHTYDGGLEPLPAYNSVGYFSDLSVAPVFNLSYLMGAGHILCSTRDHIRFLDLLFEGSVLSANSLDEMVRPAVFLTGTGGYGLGVETNRLLDGPYKGSWYEHLGRLHGYQTYFGHHKETGFTTIIRINFDEDILSPTAPLVQIVSEMVPLLMEEAQATSVPEWALHER